VEALGHRSDPGAYPHPGGGVYRGQRLSGSDEFELVRDADLVVVARLSEQATIIDEEDPVRILSVIPVRTLKGNLPDVELSIEGFLEYSRRNRKVVGEPNFTDLSTVNPNVMTGGCTRYLYARGALVVLMFKRFDSSWQQFAPTFSRASEDVEDSVDSVWVQAVTLYAAIAMRPAAEQKTALAEGMRTLQASGSAADILIAQDIERTLALGSTLAGE
jgi:hypothetical protein